MPGKLWCCDTMTVEFRVYLSDSGQMDDLREWMGGHPGVTVQPVARSASPNSQGSVWDFLSVVCAAGGPVVVAVRALQLWIEARVTVIEVQVGDRRIMVRSHDARTVLPHVTAVARALETATESPDELT